MVVGVGVVEEVEEEVEQRPQEEEETQNSLGQSHPPSMGIDKTSIDSFQTSRDTCP